MAKKKKRKKSATRTALKRTPAKKTATKKAKKKVETRGRKKASLVPADPVNGRFVIAKGNLVLMLTDIGEYKFSDTADFKDVLSYASRAEAQDVLKSYPEDESLRDASVVAAKNLFAADYDFNLEPEAKCVVRAVRVYNDDRSRITSYKMAVKAVITHFKDSLTSARQEATRRATEVVYVMKYVAAIEKDMRTFKGKFAHA